MANKVRIKASTDDFEKAEQDQGEFVLPPAGYYVLQLKEVNPGFSKDDDGKEDKKRPRLECVWSIVGVGVEDAPVEDNYGNVWDYITFGDSAGWHRAQWLKACDITDGTKEFDGEVDIDELIGTKIVARLAQERGRTKDDPKKAKIRSMIKYGDADTSAAFGEADDAGDEPFGGGDDEGSTDEPYTEEELLALEPKELGTIAKEEFSLDPAEYIVKVRGKVNVDKSKAALVEAVLAAQAEAEGEDDGENPF